MTPHFCPGSVWLCLADQKEHEILLIGDTTVQTVSPPEPWKMATPGLMDVEVSSWHGTHQRFFEEFAPPEASEVS